jgi:Grx4 family monothiol glutaredoxin
MKGTPTDPECGFSAQIVSLLHSRGVDFVHFNVLANPWVRAHLRDYSSWPTFPQLFVDGKLVGGIDVLRETIQDVFPIPPPCGFMLGARILNEVTNDWMDVPKSVIDEVNRLRIVSPLYAFVQKERMFRGYGPFVLQKVVCTEDGDSEAPMSPLDAVHETHYLLVARYRDRSLTPPSPYTWQKALGLMVAAAAIWFAPDASTTVALSN